MNERGQVTVLVAGMTMVVFAIAGLAIDGTRAFIYRRTMQSAADAAALAGASELDQRVYYQSRGRRVTIDPAKARLVASRILRQRGLRVSAAIESSEDRVRVVARGALDSMFLRLVGVDRMPVAVEAISQPAATP